MQTLLGFKKLAGALGLAMCLTATSAFAQNAGDNWAYGEDLNVGQLGLTYQLGASKPVRIWCYRNTNTIELILMLPAQNIAAGQLINAQVVMDTKPFQFSTSSTVAKDGMLEAKFLLPTNGDFMNNAIASTQMQFGIPGQPYQTVYFPPSKQDFANFNGKCQWMQAEAKKPANPQQVQQSNQGQQDGGVKIFPGRNGWNSKILRTASDPKKAINVEFSLDGANKRRQLTAYCEPNGRFDLYIADTTRTLADGSVTVEFIAGHKTIVRDGHMQGAGTDNPEIYMQAGDVDIWEMIAKNHPPHVISNGNQPYAPISVVANGTKLFTMPRVNPTMILASLAFCELPKDKLQPLGTSIKNLRGAGENTSQAQSQQTQQLQQTPTANAGAQGQQEVEWKLFHGTGRNAQFHITNPNDGNQIVMFCTPQNPDIIHAYIKHGKAYSEQRKITLNSVGLTTVKMHHNITGTTTQNGIYLGLKHDDPHWGVIGNYSTYSVNGTQIASFPIDTFGSNFYDELSEFRRQCGTTQAHKDSLTAAMKPHAEKVLAALRNGQDAFIDLNAVSVGQAPVQQATTQQQQNTQQDQPGNDGGENSLQQGLNTIGQVLQLGQQIVDLKNQLQGSAGNQNPAPQTGNNDSAQQQQPLQQPMQQQPVQQNPANQQVAYSNLATYTCENSAQFQVRYEGGNNFDRAVLIMQGIQPLPLPSVPSGSGVKYSNGSIEWHTKGPDGILKQNGQELICEER